MFVYFEYSNSRRFNSKIYNINHFELFQRFSLNILVLYLEVLYAYACLDLTQNPKTSIWIFILKEHT